MVHKMIYNIPLLPLDIELETKPVLKKLAKAHQALAELKGVVGITQTKVFFLILFHYKKPKIALLLKIL